jgi:lipopolysaccharide export system protein LptA
MNKLLLATAAILLAIAVRAQDATNAPAPAKPAAPVKAASEPTEIISDKLSVDYANNVGTFTGNVLATDPRITVRADQMIVFFSTNAPATTATNAADTVSTNKPPREGKLPGVSGIAGRRSLDKIFASGSVVISQDRRKATCDQAEYLAGEGKVTLTGNPKVQTPEGNITGYRISFWYGSERMEVDANPAETNRTRLVIYPEDIRKNKEAQEILPQPATP